MASSILIVDDEADVVDLLRYKLHGAGYEVLVGASGLEALALARERRPDAIVLDLMLPEMSGEEVCRRLKLDPETASIPVLMLTAKAQPSDRVAGLEIGADDYIVKPFSPRELVLRVAAVLRRVQGAIRAADRVEIDEFCIDRSNLEITRAGRKLELTTTEFKLLNLLLDRRGRTQSRETLLYDVWGYTSAMDTRTVDTHIRRLREKLGGHPSRIETVRGEGYRFSASRSPAAALTS
jgi:two-component system phosphate regulon response regulator PhoB